jgi:ketosteroid isomerase-like protein
MEGIMHEVQDFIKRISKTFDEKDAKGLASLFVTPSLVVSEHRIFSFQDRKEIEKEFEVVFNLFKEKGVLHSKCAVKQVIFLDEKMAILSVEWCLVTKEDVPLWNWNYTYNLVKTKTGWQIAVATPHEEPLPTGVHSKK